MKKTFICCRGLLADRRKKPETDPGNRLDKDWLTRIIPKRNAKPADGAVQALVEVHKGACAPQPAMESRAFHNRTISLKEAQKHLKWLFLHLQWHPVLQQNMGPCIQYESPKKVNRFLHDGPAPFALTLRIPHPLTQKLDITRTCFCIGTPFCRKCWFPASMIGDIQDLLRSCLANGFYHPQLKLEIAHFWQVPHLLLQLGGAHIVYG